MSGIRITVMGASGRMGRELVRAIHADPKTELAGALEVNGSPSIGQDAGLLAGIGDIGIPITENPLMALGNSDGIIDFTRPEASTVLADIAGEIGLFHVIGTTGFSADENTRIAQAATKTAVVKSGNMSLGVNLLANLVRRAAASLPAEAFDIEVVEMHHRHKVDAPSGTALLLGDAAAEGRQVNLEAASVRVRDGHTGPREEGTIGFATLRGGSVVGEHSVILAGPNERIELSHIAQDRAIFANGAVAAAKWVYRRDPGLYSMADVLALND